MIRAAVESCGTGIVCSKDTSKLQKATSMADYKMLSGLVVACVFFAVAVGPLRVNAQTQRYQPVQQKHPVYQKQPVPQEPLQQQQLNQGGYQAPPLSGAMEGPSRQLGLSGGEIELPTIRLKFPGIRFPCFSYFITPPRMHIDRDVAPHVQQVQEHISVPTGGAPPTEPFTEPARDKQPFQKASNHYHPPLNGLPEVHVEAAEIARMKREMQQLEHRLDRKLDLLTQSIERLATVQELAVQSNQPASPKNFAALPPVERSANSQISHSSYVTAAPPQDHIRYRPAARRLPPPAEIDQGTISHARSMPVQAAAGRTADRSRDGHPWNNGR